jgi:hypothetical protein
MRFRMDSFTTFEVRSGATGRKSGDQDAERSHAQHRIVNLNSFLINGFPVRLAIVASGFSLEGRDEAGA